MSIRFDSMLDMLPERDKEMIAMIGDKLEIRTSDGAIHFERGKPALLKCRNAILLAGSKK